MSTIIFFLSLLVPRAPRPFLRKTKLVSPSCFFIVVCSVSSQILTLKITALGCAFILYHGFVMYAFGNSVCLQLIWPVSGLVSCEEILRYNFWLIALSGAHNMGQEGKEAGRGWVEEDRVWFYETLDASVDKILDSSTKPSSQSPV